MNIVEWIKRAFDFIKNAFEDIIKAVFDAPQTKEFMKKAGDIIREEVLNADEQLITGGEKRDIAFKNIEDRVKGLGINYTSNLINLGIEIAVSYLRQKIEK